MTLTEVSSDLFLFLVTFRRQVRKGLTPDIRAVRSQLVDIFDTMSRRLRDDPKLSKLYEKARYPLVVTADEILINSNWAYSAQWENEILEYEFFKTRIAGEKFFMMIEEIQDSEEELAEVFYLCLCIGFVGRYKEDAEELRRLKRRLYRMVPGRISDEEKRVTPDAYYVAEGVADYRKPLVNLGRIAIVCGVLLVALWVGYFYYERSLSENIRTYAKEMREAVKPGNMPAVSMLSSAAAAVPPTGSMGMTAPAGATPAMATPAAPTGDVTQAEAQQFVAKMNTALTAKTDPRDKVFDNYAALFGSKKDKPDSAFLAPFRASNFMAQQMMQGIKSGAMSFSAVKLDGAAGPGQYIVDIVSQPGDTAAKFKLTLGRESGTVVIVKDEEVK